MRNFSVAVDGSSFLFQVELIVRLKLAILSPEMTIHLFWFGIQFEVKVETSAEDELPGTNFPF